MKITSTHTSTHRVTSVVWVADADNEERRRDAEFSSLQKSQEELSTSSDITDQQDEWSKTVWTVLAETTVEALAKRWIMVEK